MQRPLIAAMVVLAGSAQAQSSLTLYGVADSALAYGAGTGPGASSKTSVISGGNATSRFGFRGTEDLGGGNSVGFVLESQVFMDTGEGQSTNTNNQTTGVTAAGLNFARRATVSVAGGWGELRVGRDFTAHYRNRVEVDPFGNAGVANIQPFVGSIGGPISTRASNMVGYFLPSGLSGFYGQAQVFLGENPSTAPAKNAGDGQSIRIGYAAGPINISLAAGHTEYAAIATAGSITTKNLGVQYDFGIVKLMGGIYRDRVAATSNIKASGSSIGGIVPVPTGAIKFAWSEYEVNKTLNRGTKKLSLGYVHDLSKRTALYVSAARVSNYGGATTSLNGAVTSANGRSTGYDLGMRHSF